MAATRRTIEAVLFLFSIAVCCPLHADASGLQIYPLRLTLSATQPAGSIQITNLNPVINLLQVKLYSWRQANGRDVLEPSRDLLVSPPIFDLNAGATQYVRVGLRSNEVNAREEAYRIVVSEVPAPPSQPSMVQLSLRLSLPIFIAPLGTSAPQLDLSARKTDARHFRLKVSNVGNSHVQIQRLQVFSDVLATKLVYSSAQLRYILAGGRASFPVQLREPLTAEAVVIELTTGAQTIRSTVVLQKP